MKKIWTEKHKKLSGKMCPEEKLLSDVFNTKYSFSERTKKKLAREDPDSRKLFNKLFNKETSDLTELEKNIMFAFYREFCPHHLLDLIHEDIAKDLVWEKVQTKLTKKF